MDQQGQSQSEEDSCHDLLSHPNQSLLLLAPSSSSSHPLPPQPQPPPPPFAGGGGGGVSHHNQFPMLNSYTQPSQHYNHDHNQYQYQDQQHHKRETEMRHRLRTFWENQIQEIKKMTDFKNHSLPLARIKKIMKADEDVKMISAEAPMIFAKACEMFILELTLRSWWNTEENKRRTLLRNDVTLAISRTDILDFLVDIIPRDNNHQDDSSDRNQDHDQLIQQQQQQQQQQTLFSMPPMLPNNNDVMMNNTIFRQHLPYMAPVFWYPQEQEQVQHEQEQNQPPSSASDSRS